MPTAGERRSTNTKRSSSSAANERMAASWQAKKTGAVSRSSGVRSTTQKLPKPSPAIGNAH